MMPSIIIFIEAAGALAHLAPEERHMYSTRDKQIP